MKAGERRINLMKAFNAREGLDRRDDNLPPRLFEALSAEGVSDGKKINQTEFEKRLTQYYGMMNWDPQTGNPTRSKLIELGLGWIFED